MLQEGVRAVSGRHGFVDYEHAYQAAKPADDLMEKAEQFINEKKVLEALPILQALVEEIYIIIENVDDSGGEFSMIMDDIWKNFKLLAQETDPESKLGRLLFEYFLEQAKDKRYDGWLLRDDFCDLASYLVSQTVIWKCYLMSLMMKLTQTVKGVIEISKYVSKSKSIH